MPVGKDTIKKRVAKNAPQTSPSDIVEVVVVKAPEILSFDPEIDTETEAVSFESEFMDAMTEMEKSFSAHPGNDVPQRPDYGTLAVNDSRMIEVLELIVTKEQITTSVLQRAFLLGYGHAARLLDHLEELGFVGIAPTVKTGRKVLLTKDQLEAYKQNGFPEVKKTTKKAPAKKAPAKKSSTQKTESQKSASAKEFIEIATTEAQTVDTPVAEPSAAVKPATKKSTTTKSATKKAAPKKSTPAVTAPTEAAPVEAPATEAAAPAAPTTSVMANVSPETVKAVVGHEENAPVKHVQIGQKMPSYLL